MHLYFAGAEVPSWKKVLREEGVEHVALSYMGLRRRTTFKRPWRIADKFDSTQKVFLDSGAYTINNASEEKYTQRELKDIAAHYMSFVQDNIDDIEFVSEFDCMPLGIEWIRAMREDFYDGLPDGKFMPIWHSEWGVEELERLCQKYARVGVPQTALGGRNLVPALNSYVRQFGVKLHGVAMTKPDQMAAVNWTSVASTSWISPSQFGDTIIWTGKELKRYPKKMKDAARRRHRTYIDQIGFDSEKVAADDGPELIRLSLWSWRQLVSSLEGTTVDRYVVTTSEVEESEDNVEGESSLVVTGGQEKRKSVTTRPVRMRASTGVLPVMGVSMGVETYVDENGQAQERDLPLVNVRSTSQRVCSTCFLAAKCPMFEEGSNCAYEIPVTVKTKDQMQALQNGLVEMQTQRVLFGRMAEELEGGYPDPNLSSEMDRLQKMIKIKTELEQDSFSVKFEAKGTSPGQMGLMSRLFGRDAGEQAQALPAGPVAADTVIQQMDVIDAVVVEN